MATKSKGGMTDWHVLVPADLVERLDDRARRERCTRAAVIREVLVRGLAVAERILMIRAKARKRGAK